MKNKSVLFIVGALIIGIAGGFFGGMKYQEGKRSATTSQFGTRQGGGRMGSGQTQGNRMGFRPVNGEIISSDSASITVQLQDKSTKIILITDKTTLNKAAVATKEDLKNGEKVMVSGTENSDGSVTAQSIQLNPVFRGIRSTSPTK